MERVLQEAIEAALDVNAHLIAELGHDVPDDYFGGFVKLGQLGILSEELAGALAPSAGLRNRLVHVCRCRRGRMEAPGIVIRTRDL